MHHNASLLRFPLSLTYITSGEKSNKTKTVSHVLYSNTSGPTNVARNAYPSVAFMFFFCSCSSIQFFV